MAADAVLRITYSLRSSASGTMTSGPRPMKICRITGSLARTAGDIGMSRSTGTSHQPMRIWPSALTARASSCSHARREACSFGRKIIPTPYSPGGGDSMVEVGQDLQTLLDDLVRPLALDVGDEADSASVMLVCGAVQTLSRGLRQGLVVGRGAGL